MYSGHAGQLNNIEMISESRRYLSRRKLQVSDITQDTADTKRGGKRLSAKNNSVSKQGRRWFYGIFGTQSGEKIEGINTNRPDTFNTQPICKLRVLVPSRLIPTHILTHTHMCVKCVKCVKCVIRVSRDCNTWFHRLCNVVISVVTGSKSVEEKGLEPSSFRYQPTTLPLSYSPMSLFEFYQFRNMRSIVI